MSQESVNLKEHIAALDAFIASRAHDGYVSAVTEEICATQEAIVAVVPDSISNFVEQCQLRGELRCLETRLTMFKDARETLNARLDAIVEAELQSATETKK